MTPRSTGSDTYSKPSSSELPHTAGSRLVCPNHERVLSKEADVATGFDRLVAILCGTKSIREVLAFPKTQSGADPVFKSPSTVDLVVLRGYGLEPINRSSK